MLTSDQLDALTEPIVALYEEYAQSVIRDIARRLAGLDFARPTAAWQMQRMIESGKVYETAIEELSKVTGKSEAELKKMFEAAGVKSLKFDDDLYRKAGLNPLPLNLSPSMVQVLAAGLQKTEGLIRNLTMTTVASAQELFIDAADLAYMQVTSGAFDYNSAIRQAVKELAAKGLQVVHFSGRRDQVDVAMRRSVLTGVSQTTGQLQMMRAEEMDAELLVVSAHIGARNTGDGPANHESWQGRIYRRVGMDEKYPNFVEMTGYGTKEGLLGINCRHQFYAWYEGISPLPEDPAIYQKNVTYNGKEMSVYEATQKQRAIERKIRYWKQQKGALEASGQDASAETVKVKQYQAEMRDFIKQMNAQQPEVGKDEAPFVWYRQPERERVVLSENKSATVPNVPQPNSSPVPPAGSVQTLVSQLDYYEKMSFKQSYETAVVLDNSGNLVLKKDGNSNAVTFDPNEISKLTGNIITHNHPAGWTFPDSNPRHAGNSFSSHDIFLAVDSQVAAMRVISPKYIHTLEPGPTGWPVTFLVKKVWAKVDDEVEKEFRANVTRGIMTLEEAEAAHFHTVTERIAIQLGMIYNRVEHHWK